MEPHGELRSGTDHSMVQTIFTASPSPKGAGARVEGLSQNWVLGLLFSTKKCQEAQDEHLDPGKVMPIVGRNLFLTFTFYWSRAD